MSDEQRMAAEVSPDPGVRGERVLRPDECEALTVNQRLAAIEQNRATWLHPHTVLMTQIGIAQDLTGNHLPWLIQQIRDRIAELRSAHQALDAMSAGRVRLLQALQRIADGRGAFSLDRLTHAENVIEEAKTIAHRAWNKQ